MRLRFAPSCRCQRPNLAVLSSSSCDGREVLVSLGTGISIQVDPTALSSTATACSTQHVVLSQALLRPALGWRLFVNVGHLVEATFRRTSGISDVPIMGS